MNDEANPWTIVDDMEDAAEQEPAVTQGQGWDSFATTETWNGMSAAPPGASAAPPRASAAPPGEDPAALPGEPAAPPEAEAAETVPGEMAPADWFADEDSDYPDDSGGAGAGGLLRRNLADRLPRPSVPAVVTFAVACVGVMLVVSSIVWPPPT